MNNTEFLTEVAWYEEAIQRGDYVSLSPEQLESEKARYQAIAGHYIYNKVLDEMQKEYNTPSLVRTGILFFYPEDIEKATVSQRKWE